MFRIGARPNAVLLTLVPTLRTVEAVPEKICQTGVVWLDAASTERGHARPNTPLRS
jgi:hypothetical protein